MGATNTTPRCREDHAALKQDVARWATLKYVGQQHTPADEYGPEELHELRDCVCGSTLCLDISSTLALQVAA